MGCKKSSSVEKTTSHVKQPVVPPCSTQCEKPSPSSQNIDISSQVPSGYAIVKEGWGSRRNFQASYGLSMTPDGLEEGNAILEEFQRRDAQALLKERKLHNEQALQKEQEPHNTHPEAKDYVQIHRFYSTPDNYKREYEAMRSKYEQDLFELHVARQHYMESTSDIGVPRNESDYHHGQTYFTGEDDEPEDDGQGNHEPEYHDQENYEPEYDDQEYYEEGYDHEWE